MTDQSSAIRLSCVYCVPCQSGCAGGLLLRFAFQTDPLAKTHKERQTEKRPTKKHRDFTPPSTRRRKKQQDTWKYTTLTETLAKFQCRIA
jgi:hypothetical protein